jgi:hypothetical protein
MERLARLRRAEQECAYARDATKANSYGPRRDTALDRLHS